MNQTSNITPIILSGGSGSRLWPLSRRLHPKQLLPLVTDHTLLQETVLRLADATNLDDAIVICSHEHRFMVADQLQQIGANTLAIMLEPTGRNTAPAVATAAWFCQQQQTKNKDPILLVLPADHVIADRAAFQRAVEVGVAAANDNKLVTFGVTPTSAHTGYGYIKAVLASESEAVITVEQFVEKPDLETATRYVDSGDYFWNSGMFMFRASVFLRQLEKHATLIYKQSEQAVKDCYQDLDFVRLGEQAFAACPSDSIDYAVMEHTNNAVVIPLDAGWNDIGTWSALADAQAGDDNNNVTVGDVMMTSTENSYVHATHRLVGTVGLDGHIVVETPDAVLVADKNHVQNVKALVEQIESRDRSEHELHREVFRPWGSYDSVDVGERFQVKRIKVKPGAKLSLQRHQHRAEHWIVVQGEAEVTRDKEVFRLKENESTYIPIGAVHRLHNPGDETLELIEVQSGDYLGEDDIERFDDTYGRDKLAAA